MSFPKLISYRLKYRRMRWSLGLACGVWLSCSSLFAQQASPPPTAKKPEVFLPGGKWHINDMKRPAPPVVRPGTYPTPETAGTPPSDAVVLFEGKDTSQWQGEHGVPAPWKVENGAMISAQTDIITKQEFGDIQLHVEYAEPTPAAGSSQGRGNSGIYLMGLFEIQVLDNFQNLTYPDGQAGAVYSQMPPMANACRPPGEWQTYDIAFTAPRLDAGRHVSTPAYVTVFHNGVLVQNHTAILGPTGPGRLANYDSVHTEKGPLKLQFHHNAVRYRSVWLRPIVPPQ